MKVPYFDMHREVSGLLPEIHERWKSLTSKTAFIGGPEVSAFEADFGEYLGGVGCVGVANGTDAIVLALRALGVGEGDEVLVPAFTFIATASAVVLAGGRPVFVDVEPDTLNIDAESLQANLTDRSVGVIGVHLYGRPFDLEAVMEICDANSLWLVEDAAQAQGARFQGQRVGTFGALATWSFYPSKNLGCFGDGGAVTSRDPSLIELVRRIANHGRTAHYDHSDIGMNSRLDALQAAVLITRLVGLEDDNQRRRTIAARYRAALEDVDGLKLLLDRPDAECVYHQMTVLSELRDELRAHLSEREIGTGIHYPSPLHVQPALARYAVGASCPVSERAARSVLCLPVFPHLDDAEVDAVIAAIKDFF